MRTRAIATLLLLAACETNALPEGVELARQNEYAVPGPIITTVPDHALLTHPAGTCRTPCRVDYGERVVVTLGKEGYRALNVTIPVGAADTNIELQPVGRSQAVEEASLPEL